MLTKIKKLQPVRTLDVVALFLFAYAAIDAALTGEYTEALALISTISAWSLYLEATSARGVRRASLVYRRKEDEWWHKQGSRVGTYFDPVDTPVAPLSLVGPKNDEQKELIVIRHEANGACDCTHKEKTGE